MYCCRHEERVDHFQAKACTTHMQDPFTEQYGQEGENKFQIRIDS